MAQATQMNLTAMELLEFVKLSANDKSIKAKFYIEIETISEEMTTKEVAERLGWSVRSLFNDAVVRVLQPIKRGGKLIYSRERLENAIQENLI